MSRFRVLAAAACLLAAGAAHAATYPERPIRLIVPFGAGGITDIVARQLGKGLGDALGQSVVVENRPGAGGAIAAQLAVQSAPDGYTVFMGTVGTQVVNPLIMRKLSYDPDKQLQPLGLVSGSPYVLAVRADLAAKSFTELVSLAKKEPGRLNFGSAGNASSPHLGLELFKLTTATDVVHVPFKSGSEAVNAAAGGQVDMVMDASSVIMPQVQGGRLRALVVANAQRVAAAPGVPSASEVGDAGLQISSWNALFVPKDTPPAVVQALNTALQKTLADQSFRERLAQQGTEPYTGAPAEYTAFIADEKKKWGEIVRRADIKLD